MSAMLEMKKLTGLTVLVVLIVSLYKWRAAQVSGPDLRFYLESKSSWLADFDNGDKLSYKIRLSFKKDAIAGTITYYSASSSEAAAPIALQGIRWHPPSSLDFTVSVPAVEKSVLTLALNEDFEDGPLSGQLTEAGVEPREFSLNPMP